MGIPHLLEKDQQYRVQNEFSYQQGICELVDWDLFTPVLPAPVVVAVVLGFTLSFTGPEGLAGSVMTGI